MIPEDTLRALEECRASEKEQALFYRSLAALAEAAGAEDLAQRFHDLHADEQHHVSRLTARLLETGTQPAPLSDAPPAPCPLEEWEEATRTRELEEVRRYESLIAMEMDEDTRALIDGILQVEWRHADELGGKWTPA